MDHVIRETYAFCRVRGSLSGIGKSYDNFCYQPVEQI